VTILRRVTYHYPRRSSDSYDDSASSKAGWSVIAIAISAIAQTTRGSFDIAAKPSGSKDLAQFRSSV
jgi:hypothetical protein